ncbi:hypothetical protein GDO86_005981 [Hymenochirus boettgeri]|nr:hypothetical protein GDO86_005981 [Hymenochirus boettgeri]
MKTQLTRLQTEKADLLGIISELQLKLGSFSSDDSFVEIRISVSLTISRTNSLKEENGIEQEEMAISRLLHSLREETQKVEKLKTELLSANERVAYLEKQTSDLCEKEIQTENETVQNRESQCELIISGEVDLLKQKVKSLNKELQEASVKLNGAEHLKIKLQDKLKENQVSLDEKQSLAYAVKKLELHVESLQSAIKMEQNKTEVEKEQLTSLQAAYEKLNLEYQELRRNECEKVSKEEFKELLQKLDACEKALAKKQFEIDEMKETVTKHKEDMETIELLRAQIDLFCSDFHAERSARENIHQEKEELAAHLAFMMQENEKLKEEITGRQSIEQLQKRHGSTMSGDGSESPCLVPRGMESIYQQDLPVHTCPKCNLNVPDIDTLQIHVMDCIT